MELIAFAAVAVALYVLSDRVLSGLEALVGRRFEERSLIFFALLLASTLITFSLIRVLVGG